MSPDRGIVLHSLVPLLLQDIHKKKMSVEKWLFRFYLLGDATRLETPTLFFIFLFQKFFSVFPLIFFWGFFVSSWTFFCCLSTAAGPTLFVLKPCNLIRRLTVWDIRHHGRYPKLENERIRRQVKWFKRKSKKRVDGLTKEKELL